MNVSAPPDEHEKSAFPHSVGHKQMASQDALGSYMTAGGCPDGLGMPDVTVVWVAKKEMDKRNPNTFFSHGASHFIFLLSEVPIQLRS